MLENWTIGFDADDTLWQNETFFRNAQENFADLLRDHVEADHLLQRLQAAEMRNHGFYGFGAKGFTLSMIETAIEVSDGKVPTHVIAKLIAMGQEMLSYPIHLLPAAKETLVALSGRARLLLVTKGDLLDQERKLAQSGLGAYFDGVEIVSDKTPEVYQHLFAQHDRPRAMMVGNSLKSDVIPAIAAGAWGVHVPHDLTWAFEEAAAPQGNPRFHEIASLGDLPALLETLNR